MPKDKGKNCFVAIGFGPKTDPDTKRLIDLDKTFENLIKPVFDELQINCFRSVEEKHTGLIDVVMFEWLLDADIVVADISTLNSNSIYELGVRHALRPNTTIIIAEKDTKLPFDVNHVKITTYEHLGKDIGVTEANRFKSELNSIVTKILKNPAKDSPVYTFLPNLIPPYKDKKRMPPEKKEATEDTARFSELLEDAEKAKNNNEFKIAAEIYQVCLKFETDNVFLRQRWALVTYKSKLPNPLKALKNAEKILKELKPEETTDPETLGLSGAINKRIYEITKDEKFLDKAIWFYERGFYVKQDYYNGINVAFLLNEKGLLQKDKFEAISFYLQANRIREKVVIICNGLIKEKNFKERGDKEWIYQSLAQAYLGLGKNDEVEKMIPKIQKISQGQFDLDTFNEQNQKLIELLEEFNQKNNLDIL